MQEFREIQQIAISVLKSLMIKHAFDDRYASKVGSFYLTDPTVVMLSIILYSLTSACVCVCFRVSRLG